MTERLPDQRKVGVSYDQVRRERVFQHVGMPLLRWKASLFCNFLEIAEELNPAQLFSFLACEQIVRTVCRSLAEPRPYGRCFVEQWLSAVLIKRLDCVPSIFARDGTLPVRIR